MQMVIKKQHFAVDVRSLSAKRHWSEMKMGLLPLLGNITGISEEKSEQQVEMHSKNKTGEQTDVSSVSSLRLEMLACWEIIVHFMSWYWKEIN